MKVAIIAGYSPSLLNFRGPLLRAMRERGHEVVALAPSDDPSVPSGLESLGVSFVPVHLQRASTNPLSDGAALRSLVVHLRRIAPDKVLSYTPKPVIWGSLAARIVGVPDIYALITGLGRAFSQNDTTSMRHWALNRTVRMLYRVGLASCRGVLFQNKDDRELFESLHLLRRQQPTTVTAGSGIDLDYFGHTAPPQTPPTFLTLTRLLVDKGVPEFVEAAARLKPKYPDAQFRVVGPRERGMGGIPAETLARWAALGNVTFVSEVADVRPELKLASVYVLASAYREGVPRSVLEALSTGRPIITTNTPGCRDTVIPGGNGFLIPCRNASALTEAMERFLKNPALIAQLGAESRRLAVSRFDVRAVNAHVLTFMGLQ